MSVNIGDVTPPLLILDQFHTQRNADGVREVYCYRATCDGCKYQPVCKHEVTTLEIGDGLNIRRAFAARAGWKIVSVDYKQIEIRVAAVLSEEPYWIEAFTNNRDLHQEMARIAFKLPEGSVPKHLRDAAKACNFAALYLCKPRTLAAGCALTVEESADLLKVWKKTVNRYMDWTHETHTAMNEMWKNEGTAYVSTYFGRRRYFDTKIANALLVKSDERQYRRQIDHILSASVNSRIQGTAADLMKFGMVNLMQWITKEGLQDQILPKMTIHDEMVLEVNTQVGIERLEELCTTAAAKLALAGMGLVDHWPVKVETDIELGDNWAKATTPLKQFVEDNSTKTISIPSPPVPLEVSDPEALLDPIKEQEFFRRVVDTDKVIVLELQDNLTAATVDPENDPLQRRIALLSTILWKSAFPLRRKFVDVGKPCLASQGKRLYHLYIAGHRTGTWMPYKVQHQGTFAMEEIMDFFAHNGDFRKLCKSPSLIDTEALAYYDNPKPKRLLRKRHDLDAYRTG